MSIHETRGVEGMINLSSENVVHIPYHKITIQNRFEILISLTGFINPKANYPI